MSNVGYNAPQYGYGGGVPPQPMPMPMPSTDEPDTDDAPAAAVASYDVNPAAGHAPPLVVQPETAVITFDREPAEEPTAAPPAPPEPVPTPEPAAAAPEPTAAGSEPAAAPEPAAPTSPGPASSGRVAVQVVDRLRSTAERGTTTVPTPVIEKIATLAVREVPGVHEFATGTDGSGEKPITISLDGRTATIEIHLVIEYGFAVHSVTEKVRTKVISALENLFGLDVTAVDIVIDDIHLETEPAAE
jgi:uncharacterized alkaline shock family protein YloU